jgi:hypothetical protein
MYYHYSILNVLFIFKSTMNYYLFNKLHLIFCACHLKKKEIISCGLTKMFSCTFSCKFSSLQTCNECLLFFFGG